jgi:sugar phosphate isomerase/epimerase
LKHDLKFKVMILVMFGISGLVAQDLPLKNHPATDTNSDWRIAVQFWTFHTYTFFEALEKADALNLSWVEAYPGQPLGKDFPDVKFDHNLPEPYREKVKQALRERGLRIVNYGVVGLSGDEKEDRVVFEFAKDMGIESIASEPAEENLELIDRLCNEYEINLAIHNHPNPSHYWNPETVKKAVEGRSSYIGACADIGHWMRSGIKPVEALKLLEGRIKYLHFKDLNEFGNKEAHDVPWGTGSADLPSVFAELKRQNFKGIFTIEYEYHWESSIPEIRKCIAYFNKQVAAHKTPEWSDLFKENLTNAIMPDKDWQWEDGELSPEGEGNIWTKEKYGDFILDLEFKLDKKTNSGVFLRTGNYEEWLHTAIEVQILNSYGVENPDKHDCGAIYDCLEPSKNMVKAPGEWNHYTITCKANKIYVILNGKQIIDMDLDRWITAHLNPDGTPNKFNTSYKDMPRLGNIGLQYHGHPVWFRNFRAKKL